MARARAIILPAVSFLVLGTSGLLLGACGGSGSDRNAGQGSLPAAYVAQADTVCARQVGQLDRLTRPTSAEGAVAYLPQALSIMHAEVHGLEALDPRAGADAEQVADALASDRRLAALLSVFLHQLQTGLVEFSSLARVQAQSQALRAEIDSHFRHAGLEACAH